MMGRVVSTKTPKTVTVLVERKKMHPLYKKAFKRSKRYLVDDQVGVSLGDVVEIIKSRPMSKNKHWAVVKVIGKDIEAVISEQLKEAAAEIIAEVLPEEKNNLEEGEKTGLSDSKPEDIVADKSRKSK